MTSPLLDPADGVDLHVHTTVHDGRWTPAGIVEYAARRGIRCLAIADHDMTGAILPAQAAAANAGILIVPAVEVTTLWQDQEYHVLVYGHGISPLASPLGALLEHIHARQLQRAQQWVDELRTRGMALPSLDDVRRGRELMPIYVAGAVIRDGHAADYPACVRLLRSLPSIEPAAPLAEVVSAAHASGAVAIIAHPGRNENGFSTLSVNELDAMRAKAPLDGIEVYHPNHPTRLRERYLEYARSRGLLISAGSDSHGPAHARVPTPHPAHLCQALLERVLPAALPKQSVTADVARLQLTT